LKRLLQSVGQTDRLKLDQYSEAIRSVEQQIQVAERQAPKALPASALIRDAHDIADWKLFLKQ